MNLVFGQACHESFVAQWLEHPTGVRKVISSIIPVWTQIFSLSHASDMLITSFLISSPILKFTIFFLFITKRNIIFIHLPYGLLEGL